jgi:hypothetical protein
LTQSLQPPRPEVACSLALAGNLSHESRENSPPPSIKLPSSTSNSTSREEAWRHWCRVPSVQAEQVPKSSRTTRQTRPQGVWAQVQKEAQPCRCALASGHPARTATALRKAYNLVLSRACDWWPVGCGHKCRWDNRRARPETRHAEPETPRRHHACAPRNGCGVRSGRSRSHAPLHPIRSSMRRFTPGMGDGVQSSRAAWTVTRALKSEFRFTSRPCSQGTAGERGPKHRQLPYNTRVSESGRHRRSRI